MINKDVDIAKMFDEECLEITVPSSLNNLIKKEMKNYIETLELEIGVRGFTTEILEDYENAESLLMKLLLTFYFKNEKTELSIKETLALENMLYYSVNIYNEFPLSDTSLQREYTKFYDTIQDTLKIINASEIECYRNRLKKKIAVLQPKLSM